MTIQYASDLHLEFPENRSHLKNEPLRAVGDYLILAGDITYFSEPFFKDEFFDYVSEN